MNWTTVFSLQMRKLESLGGHVNFTISYSESTFEPDLRAASSVSNLSYFPLCMYFPFPKQEWWLMVPGL